MYNEVLIIVLVSLAMLFLWFLGKREEEVAINIVYKKNINHNEIVNKNTKKKFNKKEEAKENYKNDENITIKKINKDEEFLNTLNNHKIDNFLKIEGIGPKINNLLHQNNINNFETLSKTKIDFLEKILEKAGGTYTLANPKSWVTQARLAHEEKWQELEEYKNSLYINS